MNSESGLSREALAAKIYTADYKPYENLAASKWADLDDEYVKNRYRRLADAILPDLTALQAELAERDAEIAHYETALRLAAYSLDEIERLLRADCNILELDSVAWPSTKAKQARKAIKE